MLNSDDLAFFGVISASRSLADAARKLNITASAVTQRLRAVENRAGVRLVDRSSRHLALTDDGAMVAEHGLRVTDAIEVLSEALASRKKIVSGTLRVVAPSGFGRAYIAPIAAEFARAHPKVMLSLDLSDHPVARLLESHDVIIHIGPSPPANVIVTTLAENRRILCASPEYFADAPPLRSPDDLLLHRCLVLRENDEDVTHWHFEKKGERMSVRIQPVMSTNDGTVVRHWACAGMGVTIRSEWDVAEYLELGILREGLKNWSLPTADVMAILGVRHQRAARTSAFLAALRKAFASPAGSRRVWTGHEHDRSEHA